MSPPFSAEGELAGYIAQFLARTIELGKERTVELNRNQYFFLGIVIILMGLQLRMVSSYVLNQEATKFLAERTQASTSNTSMVSFTSDIGVLPNKVINPPEWLGWCLISVGSVLILHSMAMKRPGG